MESVDAVRKRPWRIGLYTVMNFSYSIIKDALKECPIEHEIVVVVCCKGPKSRASDAYLDVIKLAQDDNIDLIVNNHPDTHANLLKSYDLDIIFCAGFPWLVRADVLNLPILGCYNSHNSLLPKLRGPNALGWNLLNNDGYMGICIHKMDVEFDNGDILLTDTMPIGINEEKERDLLPRFVAATKSLWTQALDHIRENKPLQKQEGEPSVARKFTRQERVIDWARDALFIHNQSRSFYGNRDIPHGSVGTINGKKYCIINTFYYENESDCHQDLELSASKTTTPTTTTTTPLTGTDYAPGDVIVQKEDYLIIQCGDKPLRINNWKEISEEEINQQK